MGKFLVNGTIEATSHIIIKNGTDLYLQAPSSTPDDSGDLVFTKYDGTEQGRIWIQGGVGLIRFSSSDASKTLIHSGNISSQSVSYASSAGNADTVDGHHFYWSGQSGQPTWLWGGNEYGNMYIYNPSNFSVNYANSAGHSTYLNTVEGNEIRFHNATGLAAGGSLWLGWAWADGNKTVTKDWYIGNFSGGGLANIYASTFNGTLNGTASSANWASGASYSNSSNALASTGWGNGNFTYLQTNDFYGNSGWSHYLISNHGDGSSYYNFVIALPFWSYPKYKRMNEGSEGSWYNFHTTENVIIQSSTPGAGFYGQIWFKI